MNLCFLLFFENVFKSFPQIETVFCTLNNECENRKMLEAMIFRLYNKSCMINEKDPRIKVNLVSGF